MSKSAAPRSIPWMIALPAAGVLFAISMIAPGTLPAEAQATGGVVEVTSSPEVATQIRIGDVVRNTSRISGLPLSAGEYAVCFSAPEGYLAPPCEAVDVQDGETSRVTGVFAVAGRLLVDTGPEALPAEITVDGVPRDRGTVEIPIAVGVHEVCFEVWPGYLSPDCQQVDVGTEAPVRVRAAYHAVPEAEEPTPSEPSPAEPEILEPTTKRYSWTLGGNTMTREHPFTVAEGKVEVRINFTRSTEVRVALVDDGGREIVSKNGASGMSFVSSVPAGTYQLLVIGSRAHYELAVTAPHVG